MVPCLPSRLKFLTATVCSLVPGALGTLSTDTGKASLHRATAELHQRASVHRYVDDGWLWHHTPILQKATAIPIWLWTDLQQFFVRATPFHPTNYPCESELTDGRRLNGFCRRQLLLHSHKPRTHRRRRCGFVFHYTKTTNTSCYRCHSSTAAAAGQETGGI